MEILKQLETLNNEIQKTQDYLEKLKESRIDWARKNKNSIKKLYPKKNKLYQIKDIKTAVDLKYISYQFTDDVYYFNAMDIRFTPQNDFRWKINVMPTVKGIILDSNLKRVREEERIPITSLIEIEKDKTPSKISEKFTKVYVMIDKNTGYYKIGRSINPKARESTLQSEKPTIEMIFNHDARVKDEKVLHDKFKDKRVRGEWFDLNGSDLAIIRNYFEEYNNV